MLRTLLLIGAIVAILAEARVSGASDAHSSDISRLEHKAEQLSLRMHELAAQVQNLHARRSVVEESIKNLSVRIKKLRSEEAGSGLLDRFRVQAAYKESETATHELDTIKREEATLDQKISRIKNELVTVYNAIVGLLEGMLLEVQGEAQQTLFSKVIVYTYIRDRLCERNQLFDRRYPTIRFVPDDGKAEIEEKIVILEDILRKVEKTRSGLEKYIQELGRRKELYAQNSRHLEETDLFSDDLIVAKTYRSHEGNSSASVLIQALRDSEKASTPGIQVRSADEKPAINTSIVKQTGQVRTDILLRSYLDIDGQITATRAELDRLLALKGYISNNLSELYIAFRH